MESETDAFPRVCGYDGKPSASRDLRAPRRAEANSNAELEQMRQALADVVRLPFVHKIPSGALNFGTGKYEDLF